MPIKIVVTGPESTGKTSLCTQLSDRYKGTMIPEFSRTYLKKSQGFYQLKDIEIIGLTQGLHNALSLQDNGFLFCDTDALSCYIWALEKYRVNSKTLTLLFEANLPDLYLLCYPDLKWEYDWLRENPNDLERLFGLYYHNIIRSGAHYSIIYGIGNIRLNRAVFSINSHFLNKGKK